MTSSTFKPRGLSPPRSSLGLREQTGRQQPGYKRFRGSTGVLPYFLLSSRKNEATRGDLRCLKTGTPSGYPSRFFWGRIRDCVKPFTWAFGFEWAFWLFLRCGCRCGKTGAELWNSPTLGNVSTNPERGECRICMQRQLTFGGCSYSFVNWEMLSVRPNRGMLTPSH